LGKQLRQNAFTANTPPHFGWLPVHPIDTQPELHNLKWGFPGSRVEGVLVEVCPGAEAIPGLMARSVVVVSLASSEQASGFGFTDGWWLDGD
jgi:hypothetical protein